VNKKALLIYTFYRIHRAMPYANACAPSGLVFIISIYKNTSPEGAQAFAQGNAL
jgi:hypothetical protein